MGSHYLLVGIQAAVGVIVVPVARDEADLSKAVVGDQMLDDVLETGLVVVADAGMTLEGIRQKHGLHVADSA